MKESIFNLPMVGNLYNMIISMQMIWMVFGRASLYQLLNRTTSEMGANKLASWLLYPANEETILQRQIAVQELATKNEWKQHLEALGKESSIKQYTLQQIKHWLAEPNLFIQFKPWQWLRFLLPIVICLITVLYAIDIVPENIWYLCLFIYAAIGYQLNKVAAPLHNELSSMVDDLNTLSNSIAAIEKENFTSPLLQKIKS